MADQLDMAMEAAPRDPARAALGTVLAVMRLALADRALVWAALVGAMAFTAWALAHPTLERLAGVAGYAVVIFWPVLWFARPRRG